MFHTWDTTLVNHILLLYKDAYLVGILLWEIRVSSVSVTIRRQKDFTPSPIIY